MRTFLKWLGIILGVIILLLAAGFIYINAKGIPTYETEPVTFAVDVTPERVERGARLSGMICSHCHAGPDGVLSGGVMKDMPPEFGTAYAKNITRHKTAGIGNYTDGELAYLLRTGVKKDGGYCPPWMPKFNHLADEDMKDVIAYLRSDHWTVQPSDVVQPECEPSFLVKFLSNTAFKPLPYPESPIPLPDTSDPVEFGEYIALAKVECYSCHSADFTKINVMEPEKSVGFFGGGNTLLEPDGSPVLSANLTMHEEHGIGLWTKEEFINAVKYGKRPDGTLLSVAMPKYTLMTDKEAGAIYEYLRTVPKLDNAVERALASR